MAPPNLTLIAIRATLDERRELTAAGPSPTASPTETFATTIPSTTPSETEPPTLTEVAPSISATPTLLPFYFAYLIPTPTAFRAEEIGFRLGCQVAEDWLPYEVKEGDTLLSLALSSGVSLMEMRDGNCFEPIRGVFAGEILLVPRFMEPPIKLPAPEFALDDSASATVGCDDQSARIVSPAPLEHVDGVFALAGSALIPPGGEYHIALKPGWSEEYYLFLVSDQAVSSDVLGLINTEIFGAGAHRIQLTVVDRRGEQIQGGTCEIPVIFDAP